MELSPPRIWRSKLDYYKLRLTKCLNCGRASYPAGSSCPYCRSNNVKVIESEGIGEVVTHAVSYVRIEGREEVIPRVIALVRLNEGALLLSEIVDVNISEVREGLKVEAVLRRLKVDGASGLIWYGLKFRPSIRTTAGEGP